MKRRIVIVIGTILALGIAIAAFLGQFSFQRAAVYQGRTANEWLAEIFTTNQSSAIQAFHAMGPEATPVLVHALQKKDSKWYKSYQNLYPKLPAWLQNHLTQPIALTQLWNSASLVLLNSPNLPMAQILPDLVPVLDQYPQARIYILATLENRVGTGDKEYVSAIARCLQDTNPAVCEAAANVLGKIGPDAKPAVVPLTGMLIDTDVKTRLSAAWALWTIDRQTNTAAAVFREAVKNPNSPSIRTMAAIHLSAVDPGDLSAIPVLVEALHSNKDFRIAATVTLAKYGVSAREAVPALVQQIESGNPGSREISLRSLKKIDPEAAAKYEQQ